MRLAKLHMLLATMSAAAIALFTWSAAAAYVTCCYWPNHHETYTFDASVPSTFYSAINDAALTWTSSTASTWYWINSPTPGRLIKYQYIDGAGNNLAAVTLTYHPTTLQLSDIDYRIDTSENWYTGTGSPGTGQRDLRGVLTHEFGHALGLRHSNASCPDGDSTRPTMCAGYNGTPMRTLESDDTNGLQYYYPPLIQTYWRGSEGRTRQVPIVNGTPDFAQAQSWASAINQSTLPGSGDVQALAYVPIGGTLYQELWRSNTRWTRTIPIVGGIVQEGSASS